MKKIRITLYLSIIACLGFLLTYVSFAEPANYGDPNNIFYMEYLDGEYPDSARWEDKTYLSTLEPLRFRYWDGNPEDNEIYNVIKSQYNEIREGYEWNFFNLGLFDVYISIYGLWEGYDLPGYKDFLFIENGFNVMNYSHVRTNNSVPTSGFYDWDYTDWALQFQTASIFTEDNEWNTYILSRSWVQNKLTGITDNDGVAPIIKYQFKDYYDYIYQKGYQAGYDQGFNDGLESTSTKDYQDGLREGKQQGYDIGFAEGQSVGNQMGYQEAREYYGYYHNGQWITAQAWGQIQYSTGQTSETNYFDIMFIGFFGFITALGGIQLLPGLYIWHFVVFPLVFGIIFFIIGRSGGDKGGKK